ncbi:uncharacterized protein J3D65DRAFT_679856 [Phyllosticta citribraziliensis]|uniref:F-box domain-containing protein n=1 Tax=Phyllosticta citribraziliensis TaxID=989973 RepID=A0ABR1L9T2_9PEZI
MDKLPVELVENIVHYLGATAPIHRDLLEASPLVNLASTCKGMKKVCERLQFRGIIVDWKDLPDFLGKFQRLFSRDGNSSEAIQDVPEGLKWTRSFAFVARSETRAVSSPVTEKSIQRAALFLSRVLSKPTELRKLSVTLPDTATRFNFKDAVNAAGGVPVFPLVTELVIDQPSDFLLEHCPNVTSVTILGSLAKATATGILADILSRIAKMEKVEKLEVHYKFCTQQLEIPYMPQIKHFQVVGTMPGKDWRGLYRAAAAMYERMPQLHSLALVVSGLEHAPSMALRKFQTERVAENVTRTFLEEIPHLQQFSLACITYSEEYLHYPKLLSCWEGRRDRNSKIGHYAEGFWLNRRDEIDLGLVRYKLWRPSHEGPP